VKTVRSLVAAVACTLVCVVPSAAAVAATPSVTVTDPSGDVKNGTGTVVAEPRADIVSASSGADAHSSVFTVTVQTVNDPLSDPNWVHSDTGAKWTIDTNYDSHVDYVASFYRIGGNLQTKMVDGALLPKFVCFGTASYDGASTYTASFPSSSCPHLQSYQWRAEMDYDLAPSSPQNVVRDIAPDVTGAAPTPAHRTGYWMLGADGKLYEFGNTPHFGPVPLTGTFAAALTARPDGTGVWVVDYRGDVFAYGRATYQGGGPALRPGESVTTISATPSGHGYWLFTTLGRVFSYGDAKPHGDLSHLALFGPIIASVGMRDGNGYYMVGSDGGIFAFGSARFYGSMGGHRLDGRIVGISPTPTGHGYWLVGQDGGVFSFGDSKFRGSMGGKPLWQPMNGLVAFGDGYLMVASDGGVFDFSSKPFLGSLGGHRLSGPIIGITAFTT